jgi:DNA-binding response OmpR family regulator
VTKILLVDDDRELADVTRQSLKEEGFIADVAHCVAEAQPMLFGFAYDLIILDWQMPDITGIEFLNDIRKRGIQTPVLMLTGMDSFDNKAEGLDTGADDYLTKPFNRKELLARVRALLRRPAKIEFAALRAGNLVVDTASTAVTIDGEPIKLTRQEYLLLEFLMRNKNQVFNQEALVERAWSSLSESSPDTVRVHMSRLRKKLSDDLESCPIRTVHGQGYIIRDD